jgi:hypothetical protein
VTQSIVRSMTVPACSAPGRTTPEHERAGGNGRIRLGFR